MCIRDRDNYLLYLHTLRRFHKGIFLNYKEFDKACIEGLAEYDVRYNKIQDNASSLSGGNLQKLIIAREMYTKPHLLVAAQPTRGVDIGATEFIHKQIVAQRDLGSGVLLFSNELSEIISLSDRILVMYRGQIIGEAVSYTHLDVYKRQDITESVKLESYLKEMNHYDINATDKQEVFVTEVNQLLEYLLQEGQKLVGKPAGVMNREEKLQFLKYLNDKGAFLITKSGERIQSFLGISKYTMYAYLDMIKKEEAGTKTE